PFRVPVPRVLEPSLKVTVPVGVPAPGLLAVTVAVKVTDCPDSDGLAGELTGVVVLAFFTVWVGVLDVLPLRVAAPPLVEARGRGGRGGRRRRGGGGGRGRRGRRRRSRGGGRRRGRRGRRRSRSGGCRRSRRGGGARTRRRGAAGARAG